MDKFYFLRVLIIALVCYLNSVELSSQCYGNYNGGVVQELMDDDSTAAIGLGSCDFYFVLPSSPGPIYINSSSNLLFLANSMNSGVVRRLALNDPISGEMPFVQGPLRIADNNLHLGPFYGGNGGFIGVMKDGKFGYIELSDCGSLTCDDSIYQFRVIERCLNGEPGGTVNAGGAIMSPPNPIPTMSEWAVIILAQLMLILAVVALREKSYYLKTASQDGR